MDKTYYSKNLKASLSTNLFGIPRYSFGIARLIDLGSTFDDYNFSDNPDEADYRAILSDWMMVGIDLKDSINDFKISFKVK